MGSDTRGMFHTIINISTSSTSIENITHGTLTSAIRGTGPCALGNKPVVVITHDAQAWCTTRHTRGASRPWATSNLLVAHRCYAPWVTNYTSGAPGDDAPLVKMCHWYINRCATDPWCIKIWCTTGMCAYLESGLPILTRDAPTKLVRHRVAQPFLVRHR
jgi:hypothetical protein